MAPTHEIIIMSGRSDQHWDATEDWLAEMAIQHDKCIMRPSQNKQPDTVFKKAAYMRYLQGRYKIDLVLDDRPSVVRMWRAELGLPVFQVAPNLEF